MLCYRDMTFCPFWGDCVNSNDCGRKLDQYVIDSAKIIKLPIAQYVDKPNCYSTVDVYFGDAAKGMVNDKD